MTSQDSSDVMVREPSPAEMGRAVYLFRNSRLPPQARVFVAVKTRPVERFVAALAWWPLGTIVCFRLAAQSRATAAEAACGLLINQLAAGAWSFGMTTIQYADLLAENDEWVKVLKQNELVLLRSERFFEVSTQNAWTRTMEIFKKYESKIPSGWRTESIRQHPPDAVIEFIKPYRLMPPEEVRDRWRIDCSSGFELDLSSVLFDGDRPIGTLLARLVKDALCVDIRVVQNENQVLRALGNVLLFHHMAVRRNPDGPIRRLQFRGGETEHRETANLALRMGGRELPPRHAFVRTL